MKRFLIINGPNLNLLGQREPQIYGEKGFDTVLAELRAAFSDCELEYCQSNHEGEIIDALQQSHHDGIILNAGGYTHTSVAIRDAISAIEVPVVEVHISNIAARESFRHDSLLSPVCQGCIFGFGVKGYKVALIALLS
jgi:3-dehydroquinate dehydratase II